MRPAARPFSPRLLAAGLGLLLLGLATPRGIGAALRLYAEAEIDGGEAGVEAAARQLERVDDLLGDPQARIRAGLLRFRLFLSGDRIGRAGQAALAADDLASGLARAPADGRAWLALSQVRWLGGDTAAAALALRAALLSGLHDPPLTLWRCQMGLLLWPYLEGEDRALVAAQLRIGWTEQPAALLGLAAPPGYGAVVAEALTPDPSQRAAFERARRSAP